MNSKATFWDGSPVTAQDAVFSLDRAMDPKAGGFYAAVFNRVSSIEATGTDTFTIKLKQPDQWLLGELSATPGEIVQKKYVEAKGKAFGTVSGGTMCSGPFKLDSWKTGQGVKIGPQPGLLGHLPAHSQGHERDRDRDAGRCDADRRPQQRRDRRLVRHRDQHPRPDAEELVAERLPGCAVRHGVHGGQRHQGPARRRRRPPGALEAIDRQGIIDTVFQGAGSIPHAAAANGTWGYAKSTFQSAYDALPAMTQNLSKAKTDAKAAGIVGQTITIGTSSGIPTVQTETLAVQQAAQAIGLKVKLKNVCPSNYINFFIDPKAFGRSTCSRPSTTATTPIRPLSTDASRCRAARRTSTATTTRRSRQDMNAARGEADPKKRAQAWSRAQKTIVQQLPWIPLAAPDSMLVMNHKLTGPPSSFSYMFAPWASSSAPAEVRLIEEPAWPRSSWSALMLVVTLLVSSFVIFGVALPRPRDPDRHALRRPVALPRGDRQAEAQYHLDDPFLVRYWHWLTAALHGDLGTVDHRCARTCRPLIGPRIGVTAELVLLTRRC